MSRSTNQAMAPVSVIVPCYRCSSTIRAAVASLAEQSLRPSEVVLVDDFSGDGTRELLDEIAAGYPLGWVRVHALPKNGGPSRARNVGWQAASQEFVAFLDSDDWWHPRKLEWQLKVIRERSDVALVAGGIELWADGRSEEVEGSPGVRMLPRKWWIFNNPIATSTVLMRRAFPMRFNEARKRAEDYELWINVSLAGGRCAIMERTVAYRRKPGYGESGLSGDLVAMQQACVDLIEGLRGQGSLSLGEWLLARASSEVRYRRRRFLSWRRGHRVFVCQ